MMSSPYFVPLTSLIPASFFSGSTWTRVLTSVYHERSDYNFSWVGTYGLLSTLCLLVPGRFRSYITHTLLSSLTCAPASINFLNCINVPCFNMNPSRCISGDSARRLLEASHSQPRTNNALTSYRLQTHISFWSIEEDQWQTLFMLLICWRLRNFVECCFEVTARDDCCQVRFNSKAIL